MKKETILIIFSIIGFALILAAIPSMADILVIFGLIMCLLGVYLRVIIPNKILNEKF